MRGAEVGEGKEGVQVQIEGNIGSHIFRHPCSDHVVGRPSLLGDADE